MRKRTVRTGLRSIIAAILTITVVTFFHGQISDMFSLSAVTEERLIYAGLFWGGALGGFGVLLAAVGLLLGPGGETERDLPLARYVIFLVAVILMFVLLFFTSFRSPEPQRLRPGETVTI